MPRLPSLPLNLSLTRPRRGFSHLTHGVLTALLPILAYIFVRIDFVGIAVGLVLLSKWRIVAVRPRYWISNIISNGVDILVGLSFVLFMANTTEQWWQLLWAAAYAGWLIWIKPRSDVLSVAGQAMIGQLLALSALYLKFGGSSLIVLVLGTWVVAYLVARHFLTAFDEPHSALMAHTWAYFAASLSFVLGHWLLFYGTIAQIVVILTTVGYGTAGLYYLDASDRTSLIAERELVIIMIAILGLVILLSDWAGSTL